MPSRSSSSTRSLQAIFPACFPCAESAAARSDTHTLPERPRQKGPILDPNSCSIPIQEFDERAHSALYAPRQDGVETDLPAAQPEGFADRYLMPSLTHNERLRLTMLWYHTNGLLEDEDFLVRLQAIVGLVQTFFQGWEFAIMGFVSEDAFTRVATAGMELAVVPRRESPCSHTVTQLDPGKVFFLPDMQNDWRFRLAPTATQGLRGYAGAQLRCDAPGGESVALGSLCIASNLEQPTFTMAQQNALVRFADMLSAEIVGRSREARKQQRHFMARLLAECRLDELEDAENRILDVISQVYPAACVNFVEPREDQIPLPVHPPIDLWEISEGLWEDTERIDELIKTSNHKSLRTGRTVRAIIHPVQTFPVVRYLVVASSQVQHIFDDVDSWFVQNCAMALGQVVQERMFSEALMVKERFLRGITHQLRTPIHGVLASCDLLTEELSNRKLLGENSQTCHDTAVTGYLDAIRDSGKELMTTVNNMLKLNRWAETSVNRRSACLNDWTQFEDDIISEVEQNIPAHELSNVSIFFNNDLSEDNGTTSVDIDLLKECVQSLVLNAMQATKQGAVTVAIHAATDRSHLEVDVVDTGLGIDPVDFQRIFDAYEKVDYHGRGAGLGLTLATNIAKLMRGNLILLESSQAPGQHGSHFRATVATPSQMAQVTAVSGPLPEGPPDKESPLAFHLVRDGKEPDSDLIFNFAKYLRKRGFQQNETAQDSIALLPYVPDLEAFERLITENSAKMAICLVPTGATPIKECHRDRVLAFTGPFTSLRLKQILVEIHKVWDSLQHTEPSARPNGICGGHTRNGSAHSVVKAGLDTPLASAAITPFALLVDDNTVNLKIMRMYCEKRGIEHATAMNGREAVDRFRETLQLGRPYNLILMDLQMPVCDGADATQEIRDLEREAGLSYFTMLVPSRIFMVTGQDSLADKTRSFAAGADEFYVKPMGMKKLDLGINQYFPSFRKASVGAK